MEPNWKGFERMKGSKCVGVHNSTFLVLVLLLLLSGRSCHLSLILNFEYLKARTRYLWILHGAKHEVTYSLITIE